MSWIYFYYEIYLKYCQDTDVDQEIDNLLQQWKTILGEKACVACLTQGVRIMDPCEISPDGQILLVE